MAELKVKEDFVHEIVDIDTIPVPVSYTHLDVYKRQALLLPWRKSKMSMRS